MLKYYDANLLASMWHVVYISVKELKPHCSLDIIMSLNFIEGVWHMNVRSQQFAFETLNRRIVRKRMWMRWECGLFNAHGSRIDSTDNILAEYNPVRYAPSAPNLRRHNLKFCNLSLFHMRVLCYHCMLVMLVMVGFRV